MIDQNTKIIMSYRELEFHDKQIRADAIEEYKTALIKAFSETNINEYGFYPQNIVDMVAIKLKEQTK